MSTAVGCARRGPLQTCGYLWTTVDKTRSRALDPGFCLWNDLVVKDQGCLWMREGSGWGRPRPGDSGGSGRNDHSGQRARCCCLIRFVSSVTWL
ncbi:hypothetical protein ACFFX0_17210 [Citricoccus parietis]|uniref:Uncharacterized protein n=1 Tax=Citricoccus parietis TaxID=592307 RepID=A0ABV5G1N2_9MICC